MRQSSATPQAPALSPLRLAGTAVYLLAWPAMQLWLSGNWLWVEGWIFGAWLFGISMVSLVWLQRHDPALLAERYRPIGSGGQSRADIVMVLGLVLGFIAWTALPPLDLRYGWTPRLPRWLEVPGGALLAVAAFFLFRSFTDNTFLSGLVRIQKERRHHVVSTGVYGFVRHPMYLGATAMFVGGALLFGSTLGLIVGLALVALLGVRILGEEKLLTRELEGYEAYRRKVRYRLLPGVW